MANPVAIYSGAKKAIDVVKAASSTSKIGAKQGVRSKLKDAASAAGAVGTGFWGVDMVLDFVKDKYPEAFEAMARQLNEFGIDIDDPALREATGQTRDQLIAMMAQNGVGEEAVTNLGLSKLEALQYLKILKEYREASNELNDDNQAKRASTGEEALDIDIMNVDIAKVCAELGLIGRDRARKLYQLARIINTIRESDVQNFERHEALFGSIRVQR